MAGYGSGGAADADELRQKEFVRPCAEDFEGLLLPGPGGSRLLGMTGTTDDGAATSDQLAPPGRPR
jgi:hypothetical protein